MKRIAAFLLFLLASPSFAENYSHYYSVARAADGAGIASGTVAVYAAGTSTLSTLANDSSGSAHGNPFLTDSLGNYDFWAAPGVYKITVTKISVGTFTIDNVPIGTQPHASKHAAAGSDPISLSTLTGTSATPQKVAVAQDNTINSTESELDVHTTATIAPTVTNSSGKSILTLDIRSTSIAQSMLAAASVGLAQLIDSSITDAKVNASAGILESKLALNFPTHANTNDPSSGQKAALVGTSGTPGGGNKYVTAADSRLSDSRSPLAHASTHTAGSSDPISIHASQISDAGSDLTQAFSLLAHKTQHQLGGSDALNVGGLSGTLADTQKILVKRGGTTIGTRPTVNFIEGGNVTLTLTDNSGANRVDVQIDATPGAISGSAGGDLGGTYPNPTVVSTSLASALPVAQGGTNLTAALDDHVPVGNGTTWQSLTIPDCTDTAGNHLNYVQGSNSFACGTSGGGSGTVTSVGMTLPAWLSVSGSPVTTSGTLAVTATTGQTANSFLASPDGTTGALSVRSIVGADLPNPSSSTLGGVQSKAAVTSNFLTQISTSGVVSQAQPAFTDISGSVTDAQVPDSITVDLATAATSAKATISAAGIPAAVTTTAAAQTSASTAGVGLTITADSAVAGSSSAGAAAGGSLTLTTGAGARLTSGNANGGDLNLTTGAGIGTGLFGNVVQSNGDFVIGTTSCSGNCPQGAKFHLIVSSVPQVYLSAGNGAGGSQFTAGVIYGGFDMTSGAQLGANGLSMNPNGFTCAGGSGDSNTGHCDTFWTRAGAGIWAAGTTGTVGNSSGTVILNQIIEQSPNGATAAQGQSSELLTLSTGGASTDSSADLLPADSIITGVTCRITTTIATATDWSIGDGSLSDRFCLANSTLTAGTTSVCLNQWATAGNQVQTLVGKLRVTTTGTPSAGAVRCTVFATTFVAPTS